MKPPKNEGKKTKTMKPAENKQKNLLKTGKTKQKITENTQKTIKNHLKMCKKH